ncbi:hypothetical protein A5686_22015 [Mycobacterium sp. E2479]|nr:hypothetical protein A5686_22015 [Mycobacterium sp. E2479]
MNGKVAFVTGAARAQRRRDAARLAPEGADIVAGMVNAAWFRPASKRDTSPALRSRSMPAAV